MTFSHTPKESCQDPQNTPTSTHRGKNLTNGHFCDRIYRYSLLLYAANITMTRENFDYMLCKHFTTLSLMAQQQTSHSQEAEDLLQDTVLLLLERVEMYEDINFVGYCYTLLHNLYRNQLRHNRIVEGVDDLSQYDCLCEGNYTYYNEIVHTIEQLPLPYASAIKMHISGYTYEEIASLLHVSIGTVKSRISRARTLLQAQLKEYR